MVRSYSSEAFIIARKNYSEADRILTLLTKDYGKLIVLAKGVRKLKSRKRSSIENFSYIKFSATKTKSLDIITETQTISSFNSLREDLKKVAVAYFFCETLDKLLQENEQDYVLFEIAKKYFDELSDSKGLKLLRYKFIEETLIHLGFWPQGKKVVDPDGVLEAVVERKINSKEVGRKLLV